jgi:DNA-binding IscR family transcriptional regulator
MLEVRNSIANILDHTTLADVAARSHKRNLQKPLGPRRRTAKRKPAITE